MNLGEMLLPVPSEARFQAEDFYTWCGSMLRDQDGKCHLFYSRWPRSTGFQAWVSHSEIAHAVSDEPTGPYQHVDVALPAVLFCAAKVGDLTFNVHIPLAETIRNRRRSSPL
jgi:hypothetical protein